jgi:tryptophan-rich hypothetical protein
MTLPKQYSRLVGSKWTATREVLGWRHFHVISVQREQEGGYGVELAASCDMQKRARVTTGVLLNPAEWTPGWTPLSQLSSEKPD